MSDEEIFQKTLALIPVGYIPNHKKENLPALVADLVRLAYPKEIKGGGLTITDVDVGFLLKADNKQEVFLSLDMLDEINKMNEQ